MASRRPAKTAPPQPPAGHGTGREVEPGPIAAGLFATPPDAFVAARDALARQLAEARDPLAAAVRKLRRPAGLAWVLNHLAQHEGRAAGELLAAGDALRLGQAAALEGSGAGGLRAGEVRVRDAARALRLAATPVLQAHRASPPALLGHLERLLRALATAPDEEREAFRRGVLLREPDLSAAALSGLSSLGDPAAVPPRASPPGAERPPPRAAEPGRDAAARERQRELDAGRAEEARRRQEAEERARELDRAARALEAAERTIEARRAALRAVQERLDAARAELEAAEHDAARQRDRLRQLGAATAPASSPPAPRSASPAPRS